MAGRRSGRFRYIGRSVRSSGGGRATSPVAEPPAVRGLLIAAAAAFLVVFVLLPVVVIFAEALDRGLGPYLAALAAPDTLAAAGLTALSAAVSVPANTVFGIAAAWAIARYDFPGRSLLVTLIDLPLSVSPVIAGLVLVLVFGAHGLVGRWLTAHDIRIIFAVPGIVLATTFVTLPLVAREVLAVLESEGQAEEEAALTLGASGPRVLFCVTLPRIRRGLAHGVILCNARAIGEFGAVSVVSGHIRGETNTLPLHVELLYNEFNFVGAFAVASLLALVALGTLGVKELGGRGGAAR